MINDDFRPKTIAEVFLLIKQKNGLKTDAETWKALGLSRAFYQDVKAGRKHLGTEKALQIASKAGLSPESMLLLNAREKAATATERALWDNIIHGKRRIMDNTVHNVG